MFREKLKCKILESKGNSPIRERGRSLLPRKDRCCPRKLVMWGTSECRAGLPGTMMGITETSIDTCRR